MEKPPINPEIKKIVEQREARALPQIENFLNNLIIYIIPNHNKEDKDNSLYDYIQRNDFIYHFLMREDNGNLENNNIIRLKEYMCILYDMCIYLMEAKYFFELDIYKIILKPDPLSIRDKDKIYEEYFYSYREVEVFPGSNLKISYLNNQETQEYENFVSDVADIKKLYHI